MVASRLVLTNPKPEQVLSVLTHRHTENLRKVSVSQSNILNSHRAFLVHYAAAAHLLINAHE